ncbi:DUF1186 domain-containing protein [Armatimonas sp.]|uniref:DUF1186 domain-containing protein n=1 Tax=Armatimonas sp. TaxID=1872638 RepID=UPI00286C95A1|nr:DUF1186 domain-containing protein [Armatimonas sp.]
MNQTQDDLLSTLDQLADADWDTVVTPKQIEALVTQGEALVPALLERIIDEALRARNDGELLLDNIAYLIIFALCELAIPETAEPVFHACFEGEDHDILEWLDNVLWKFGPSAVPILERVVCNDALDWYARAVALEVLEQIARDTPETREAHKAFLIKQLTEHLDRGGEPENDHIASLISDLTNLRDPEARPLIARAFAENRVDRSFITEENVEDSYKDSGHVRVSDRSTSILEDYRAWHQQNKLEMQEIEARRVREALKESQRMIFQGRPAPPPSKKPGRNDPCWCGSGKKYKKCHLEADQKR